MTLCYMIVISILRTVHNFIHRPSGYNLSLQSWKCVPQSIRPIDFINTPSVVRMGNQLMILAVWKDKTFGISFNLT